MGMGKFRPHWGSKTPERISMKLGIYNYVGGMTTHAKPHCVRWGPSYPHPPKKGHSPPNFRQMSIVAKRSLVSATDEHLFNFILGIAPSPHWWTDFDDLSLYVYVFPRKEVTYGGCNDTAPQL